MASSYRSRCRHYNTWPWSWGRGRWKGWKSKRNRARTEARGIRAGERRMAGIYPARWRRNFGFRKHAHVVSNEDWYLCRVLQGHGDRKRTAGQSEGASQHCIRKLRLNMEHPPSSAQTSIRIGGYLSLGTPLPHPPSASQFAGCGPPLTDALITERAHTIPSHWESSRLRGRCRSVRVPARGQSNCMRLLVRGWSAGSRNASARVAGVRMGGSVPRGLWPFYPNMAILSTNRPHRRACEGLDARAGTHRGNMAILASDDPSSDDALENGRATPRDTCPPPS